MNISNLKPIDRPKCFSHCYVRFRLCLPIKCYFREVDKATGEYVIDTEHGERMRVAPDQCQFYQLEGRDVRVNEMMCYECEKPALELNDESRCIHCVTRANKVNRDLVDAISADPDNALVILRAIAKFKGGKKT